MIFYYIVFIFKSQVPYKVDKELVQLDRRFKKVYNKDLNIRLRGVYKMNMTYGVFLSIVINIGMDKIVPSLKEIMQNTGPDEKVAILVHMAEKPDFEKIKNLPPKEYVEYIKNFAENSQRDIINYLKTNFSNKIEGLNPYWIFNGFYVKATKDVIEELAKREDVEYIIEDFVIQLEEVKPADPTILTPTWNVTKVKADSCWNAGYTGAGVIIGHMDTGVDINHPALQGKWLSPYWYDPINGQPNPYDDNGHGTHTMGTILGGDGNGPFANDIGVAPGAKFVACKICNSGGSCPSSAIHAGFQQIATWRSQGVLIVAASNSWGSTATTSTEFWQDCINWRNVGIFPVFSIGNSGPSPNTAGTPGNFPIVIGVGATDANDNIASFSSRGPAPNQAPWNQTQYWMRPDWNRTKPDISAPGSNVYSSLPGGSYGNMSGTSMACPHVTGAIAIINQKNSALDVPTIYNLLLDWADKPSQGAPYPNNNYGWGRLNIYQALLHTPTPTMPNVYLESYTLQDAGGNGYWDPGETAYIRVTLRNTGANATNVNGTLRTTSPYVTIQDSTS
ncbi:MAG: S8 family serine peptidase, partial [candidate division WOR-3 bacterium]